MKSTKSLNFYAPERGYYRYVGNADDASETETLTRLFLAALGKDFYTTGGIIRHFRQLANLSQRELALRARIDYGQLSRYENNERSPRAETLTSLEKALGKDFGAALALLEKIKAVVDSDSEQKG